ncbi:MAG: class I SAM-dependent DNA methyltransferase [Syntrophobacteraceae bacterium]|nr:class I SAM-dependent DNA methyltransferase [Syntrophobacteraceae bacterium]
MPKLSLAKLERHLYGAADFLRREGMDAATYKDFIFGMLFLKRCSDVFETAFERIVQRKVEQGMRQADAEAKYGENPDFYDDFFVPQRARWSYLQSKLNDAAEPYGAVLDKALSALSEANESLQHVLDHIQFMKVQSNKRIVSDEACKDLARHFNRYRLRSEDFQFSDLLGSAYEFLINMFAESAGKKGGDFYTPRDVIRLMVRILNPVAGMRIYDPTCGSGGMLIISREHIEQSGGDSTNLRLCGQVNDASAWSICKINMLLHGIQGADIQLQDTLLHPLHRDGGELDRFDRVIANPPFSQNYTKSNMEFPERFRWGWCPTSGKKGDLMFTQHMLAVCRPNGMVATVMPHGVLFRGGAEKEIRKKFLQEDLIEAVISLPPNLFYGAGIPACVLIMRPNLTGRTPNPNKPSKRRGRILFINADAEYLSGRAQNYLRPEHIEKIASTFERYEDVPGYSRAVTLREIAEQANDFNLNIRRYVDNSPSPEPQDVRAHLAGGVPVAEVASMRPLFEALGFNPDTIFTRRAGDGRYHDFSVAAADRASIASLVEGDAGVRTRIQLLRESLATWWTTHSQSLADLPRGRNLNGVRSEILRSFIEALLPLLVLDRFKLAGVVAGWWTDTLPDLKTLIENGFCGVVDGWIDAIADAVEDDDNVGPAFDPFSHKLVQRAMSDYLEQIDEAKLEIARLKGNKEAFEQSSPPDEADEEELATWNYAKDLERQSKELKTEYKDALKVLAKLTKAAAKKNATDADCEAADSARCELQPFFGQIAALEAELAPYERIRADLAASRATFRALSNAFVDELKNRCGQLTDEEKRALVLDLFAQDLQAGIDATVLDKRNALARCIENLWDKYRVVLRQLLFERANVETRLGDILAGIGYE